MKDKVPLISWSGGVDSTAVVIWYFSKGIPFETVYVKVPNNKFNQAKELAARKLILKKLTDIYGNYCIKDHVINHVLTLRGNRNYPVQAYIWATSICAYLDLSRYKVISFGYIRGDDFWHFRPEFENLITAAVKMADRTNTVEFEYMLEWRRKHDVIDNFYKYDGVHETLEMTHVCESTEETTKKICKCSKCQELKSALKLTKKKK